MAATRKRKSGKAKGSIANWTTGELPDSDLTVLMRLTDAEHPIWPGFHDGERWISADATEVQGPVLGWMHLEDAAVALDKGGQR